MKSYEVGQIIYILDSDKLCVHPVVIAEEERRMLKNLEGEKEIITYTVYIGPKSHMKKFNLQKIKGEIFDSFDKIKEVMKERFDQFIDKLFSDTQKKMKNWYDIDGQLQEKNQVSFALPGAEDGMISPSELIEGPAKANTQPDAPLRERLKNLVTPNEQERYVPSTGQTLILPNGEKINLIQ